MELCGMFEHGVVFHMTQIEPNTCHGQRPEEYGTNNVIQHLALTNMAEQYNRTFSIDKYGTNNEIQHLALTNMGQTMKHNI